MFAKQGHVTFLDKPAPAQAGRLCSATAPDITGRLGDEEAGDQGRKGLMRMIPQPSKSAVFRVASGILWSIAVAAMSMS